MPTLSVTNLTSSRLPVGKFVGILSPNELKTIDLTSNEIEMSKDQLVGLAAAGHISWDVTSTASEADNKAEAVMGGAILLSGSGTPEAVVTAPVGAAYLRTDGAAGTTLYVKESGTSNTGWVGK